ncbi:MAG: CvpA family protein [Ruminococcus sp.]|jgi:uncharacterized membrane protein required for colicin V production
MNWLFWVLLIFTVLSVIRGGRKGFVRTAVSMVSLILVMVVAAWLNPYVGRFLRESTPVYQFVEERCEALVSGGDEAEDRPVDEDEADQELPLNQQIEFIENMPLPQSVKDALLENNNSEIYNILGVERFGDYIAGYIAYYITNGIGYILSFVLAIIIIKVILYAVDILTELPGISFINAVGGMILGVVQAVLWIWIFFIIATVLCNTPAGQAVMDQISGNELLKILYDRNLLMNVILDVIQG